MKQKEKQKEDKKDRFFVADVKISVYITPEEARKLYVESLKQLKRNEDPTYINNKVAKLKRLTEEEEREADRIAGTWALLQADLTARYR